MKSLKTLAMFSAGFIMAGLAAAPAAPVVPNPVLYLTSTEYYTTNGQDFVRYRYDVFNRDSYPAEMFAAAPQLPPAA